MRRAVIVVDVQESFRQRPSWAAVSTPDIGYDVTFVTDATATFAIQHRDAEAGRRYEEVLADSRTLQTDAIIERTEYALAGRFATIRTLEEVVAPAAARLAGWAAAAVARSMVVFARRNGDDRQDSAMLRHRNHLSDVAHRVQDTIEARVRRTAAAHELAHGVGVSERTLPRAFDTAVGMTPLRYQQLVRVEHLIEHGATVESAAHAVGLGDARMLRRLRARA